MKQKILSLILAFSFMGFTTGCASGGFKLTRQFSRWVNSQHIIIRIILYILLLPVYAVTLLIDAVVFNTMDFWEGRVSQGTYNFKSEDKTFVVKHEILNDLKKSTIRISDLSGKLLNEIVIQETQSKNIEFYLNGKLKQRAEPHKGFALISEFDPTGSVTKRMPVDLNRRLLAWGASKPRGL